MRNLFALPDAVLLQLYKRVSPYLIITHILFSVVVVYAADAVLYSICGSVMLLAWIQSGIWVSLKFKRNYMGFFLPLAMVLLGITGKYSGNDAPFYIFTLLLFVHIGFWIPGKIVRLVYLCLALLTTVQMAYPVLAVMDVLRIGVTYFVGAFAVFVLVDHLKRTGRDIAHKNQDITDIFNGSPLPIMLLELSGTISMINDSFLELVGFTQEELKGKTLRDIFYFETSGRVSELLRYFKAACNDNKTLHVEEEYRRRNGETITLSADIKPLELHGEKYILLIGQDATRELKLRKEIQRTHKLYRTMAANIPNSAIFMFDRQLRFILVEGDNLNKDGINKSKMVGKTFREIFSEASANILEQYFTASLLGVESSIELEENGKHYVYYFLPVRAENNQIMSGIALSVNITELKQTRTEVDVRNRMIDAYAHKASHVVRRPVANILGLAEILMNKDNTEEEKQTALKFIYDSIKELDNNLKDAAVELNKKDEVVTSGSTA
jgi:PAS domain S-box-containing protein